MRLVDILESRKLAPRASMVAPLFSVTQEHAYKMTTKGILPVLDCSGHSIWGANLVN